jgi:hypothetical protein
VDGVILTLPSLPHKKGSLHYRRLLAFLLLIDYLVIPIVKLYAPAGQPVSDVTVNWIYPVPVTVYPVL